MTSTDTTATATADTTAPAPSASFLKEAIREAVLDSKAGTEIVSFRGQDLEIREPSLERLVEFRNMNTSNGEQDPHIMAKMIVHCTFVPGTNGEMPIFGEEDIPAIMKLAFGQDMKLLITVITRMFADDALQGKIEDNTKSPEA